MSDPKAAVPEAKTAGFVTVALKHPNGLTLRVHEEYTVHEPVMGGGSREVKAWRPKGDPIELAGNSAAHGMPILLHGGYALTSNIPADSWEAWLAQNKDTDLVKKNLIFAMARGDSAASKGREMGEIKSGLERLDPDNLPSIDKQKVETARAA